MTIRFDVSAWPLVNVEVSELSKEGIASLTSEYDKVFARHERFAALLNTEALQSIPSAAERKVINDWSAKNEHHMKRWNIGAATVVTSGPVRAAMTALTWVFRPPSPQYYASSALDGIDWCIGQLEEEGLPINERIDALRHKLMMRDLERRAGSA